MQRLSMVCVISGAVTLSGCAEGPDDLSEEEVQELRHGLFSDGGIGEDPSLPGNGDLTIYFGGEAGVQGCDIWDFTSNDTRNAQTGELIFRVIGDDIRAPNGDLLCRRDGDELFERMRTSSNEVVFTVMGPFIFDGELELDGSWWQNMLEMCSKLLYTFEGQDVYDGMVTNGEVLVSADVNIRWSSRMRKFAIASLIAGECGGPGLPPHPEH